MPNMNENKKVQEQTDANILTEICVKLFNS